MKLFWIEMKFDAALDLFSIIINYNNWGAARILMKANAKATLTKSVSWMKGRISASNCSCYLIWEWIWSHAIALWWYLDDWWSVDISVVLGVLQFDSWSHWSVEDHVEIPRRSLSRSHPLQWRHGLNVWQLQTVLQRQLYRGRPPTPPPPPRSRLCQLSPMKLSLRNQRLKHCSKVASND